MDELFPSLRPIVPQRYSGKWIVWSNDRREIVKSGDTLKELYNSFRPEERQHVAFERIPPLTGPFLGQAE